MLDAAGVTDPAERARLNTLLANRQRTARHPPRARRRATIRPAPGGDLLRTTEVLPTGRNLHGFDPFRLPSAFAVAGRRAPGRPPARTARSRWPRPAGNGGDGAVGHRQPQDRRRADCPGAVADGRGLRGSTATAGCAGRTLVPLGTLGRPRIDVAITVSGNLPRPAAAADQAAGRGRPARRDRRRAGQPRTSSASTPSPSWPQHGGTMEAASLRVFGNADGALRQQRQSARRLRRVERGRRAGRSLRRAQGLRLRRVRPPRAPCGGAGSMCWPAWTSPTRCSIPSSWAS